MNVNSVVMLSKTLYSAQWEQWLCDNRKLIKFFFSLSPAGDKTNLIGNK